MKKIDVALHKDPNIGFRNADYYESRVLAQFLKEYPENQEKYGDWLRDRLDHNYMTQAEFGRIVGCGQKAISRFVLGDSYPDDEMREKIADYFYNLSRKKLADWEDRLLFQLREPGLKWKEYQNRKEDIKKAFINNYTPKGRSFFVKNMDAISCLEPEFYGICAAMRHMDNQEKRRVDGILRGYDFSIPGLLGRRELFGIDDDYFRDDIITCYRNAMGLAMELEKKPLKADAYLMELEGIGENDGWLDYRDPANQKAKKVPKKPNTRPRATEPEEKLLLRMERRDDYLNPGGYSFDFCNNILNAVFRAKELIGMDAYDWMLVARLIRMKYVLLYEIPEIDDERLAALSEERQWEGMELWEIREEMESDILKNNQGIYQRFLESFHLINRIDI